TRACSATRVAAPLPAEADEEEGMTRLNGQVALVTGGASGLGAEVCRVLAGAGARVVCADLDRERAQRVCAELARDGVPATPLALDVSRADAATRAVEQVAHTHDGLDILINSAAIDVTRPADELAVEDWERIIATNLNGPYWLARVAFPVRKRRGGGQIVNLASTATKGAWAAAAPYHASKWGLLGLSHALHVAGRAHGIKVTALVSGGMRTPFLLGRF